MSACVISCKGLDKRNMCVCMELTVWLNRIEGGVWEKVCLEAFKELDFYLQLKNFKGIGMIGFIFQMYSPCGVNSIFHVSKK